MENLATVLVLPTRYVGGDVYLFSSFFWHILISWIGKGEIIWIVYTERKK